MTEITRLSCYANLFWLLLYCYNRKGYDKPMEHCTAFNKMELVYDQTRQKGQGNPELALKHRLKIHIISDVCMIF